MPPTHRHYRWIMIRYTFQYPEFRSLLVTSPDITILCFTQINVDDKCMYICILYLTWFIIYIYISFIYIYIYMIHMCIYIYIYMYTMIVIKYMHYTVCIMNIYIYIHVIHLQMLGSATWKLETAVSMNPWTCPWCDSCKGNAYPLNHVLHPKNSPCWLEKIHGIRYLLEHQGISISSSKQFPNITHWWDLANSSCKIYRSLKSQR